MNRVQDQLKLEIEKQSILKHPFYQLWSEGKLPSEALRVYAKQYYHFVENLPHLLETMLENCKDPAIRSLISKNLNEEMQHPHLWLAFANSLGLGNDDVISSESLPETVESLQIFQSCMVGPTPRAAAALLAYEALVPAVARQKMEGLIRFYGIKEPEALEFFKVHMEVDLDHVKVWEKILNEEPVGAEVLGAAKRSLKAQWGLLDGVLRACQLNMQCEDSAPN